MALYVRTLLVTGPPDEVKAASTGHVEHLRQLRERGKLRLAGTLGGDDGFLEVFEAADLREAQAIGEASPLVSGGLAAWMLREFAEIELG